jgi:ABC-type glycerol-3-phosphate transport system substrate-binding protein
MLKRNRIGLIFFALILAAAFVFTGCKKGPSLKGAKVTVASWSNAYNVNTYEPRNEGEELQLEYRKKFLADNNLSMETVEVSDWDGYLQMVPNLFMSGNKDYSIYALPADVAMTLFRQGLLFPLSDSKNFPNTRVPIVGKQGQWQQLVEDLFTINGKCYGIMYGTPGASWQGNFIFFNKRLFREAGLDPDLPFNMQRDGTWTWDNFLNICKQLTRDINNNGVIDVYALPSDDIRELMYGLVYSNNGNFVTIDNNGKYQNATTRPEFIEALQFFQRLVNEGVVKVRREGVDEWGWNWSEFMDGRVAMVFDPEWRQGQAPEMVDDYGIVLAPKGPRASNYRTSLTEICYAIPSYFTLDEVNIILEAWDKWNLPQDDNDWKTGYYPFHRDRRSVDETMALQRQVAVYRDFAIVPGWPGDAMLYDERWWESGTPAQIVESWAPRIQAVLDEANR